MTTRAKTTTERKTRKTAEVTVLPPPPRERATTGLRTLKLRNVRCFVSVDIPLDAKVTVIIGQNGSGKTTIAEVLASLAHGEREGLDRFPLRQGAADGSIALIGDGAKTLAAWEEPSAGAGRSRLSSDRLLFAYGRYRRVHFPEAPPSTLGGMPLLGPEWERALAKPRPESLESAIRRARTMSVMRPDNDLLRDIGDYLPLLHARRSSDPGIDRAWQRFDASLAELDEQIERIEVIEREHRAVAVLIRRGVPLELKELSDGYQAMLAIIVDLLIWYVQLFAHLPDPLLGEATVVIDEVDLHLHPRWQRAVIGQLTKLFPATQFILTTHSAAVVQGAIDQRYPVLVLEEREGEGTRIRALTPKDYLRLDGAQIGSVLVDNHVFDVSSRYSKRYEDALETEAAKLGDALAENPAAPGVRKKFLTVLDQLQGQLARAERLQGEGPLFSEIARAQIAFLKSLTPAEPARKQSHGAVGSKARQGVGGLEKAGRKGSAGSSRVSPKGSAVRGAGGARKKA